MERFASGWKQNYYGKGDVIVYRLNRDGDVPEGCCPVFGASVKMLLYGDLLAHLHRRRQHQPVATDSMKNFIQRETLNFNGTIWSRSAIFWRASSWRLSAYRRHPTLREAGAVCAACRSAIAFAPSGPTRPMHPWNSGAATASSKSSKRARHSRLSHAAPRRQRLPRIPPRSVHDPPRHHESPAPHVVDLIGITSRPMPRSAKAK